MDDSSSDEIWGLFEFCATEALLLRSFLEYLRTWPDPWEKKLARLQKWHEEIGLQLGNPKLVEQATATVRKVRDAPPELRKIVLQQVLAAAYSTYFGPSS